MFGQLYKVPKFPLASDDMMNNFAIVCSQLVNHIHRAAYGTPDFDTFDGITIVLHSLDHPSADQSYVEFMISEKIYFGLYILQMQWCFGDCLETKIVHAKLPMILTSACEQMCSHFQCYCLQRGCG